MNFLSPFAFAFAAAIPVVIVFYLLKRKRVVKLVSSTLLWQKFLAETQASAPFQKLRHNWLLVLQIALLTFVVLALARPYFAGKVLGNRLLVAILDASASMQSTDEEPSRFEHARQAALGLVDSLQDSDQMVVLLAGAHTEVKQSPTSDKGALRRALQNCEVTDSPTRLIEAFKLAQPLVKDRKGAEVHLFSDGATSDLTEFENEALNLVYHRQGRQGSNAGIVNLDVRSHPDDPTQRAVFVGVFNAATNPAQAELELRLDGKLLETRPLTLGPRETSSQVFTAAQASNGLFNVHLTLPDDLATDNDASIVSVLPQPVNLLLVSRGNRFLEKALVAVPNVRVTVVKDLSDDAHDYDIVILDDVLPAVWPVGNTLAIRSAPTNWVEVTGRLEAPTIVDWKSSHPLLRFVNFDNVQISEAVTARTPSWALSILDSPASSLILAGELGRHRIVWFAFDTLQSTWPLRISFPIFLANAVEWLNPAATTAAQFQIRAGDPLRFALAEPVASAHITLPDHSEKQLTMDPGGRELVFGDTQRSGVYRLQADAKSMTFCVNLLDAMETDTTPRAELNLGRYVKVQATNVKQANLELWRWLAVLGLGLLLFEWWYYHRRTA